MLTQDPGWKKFGSGISILRNSVVQGGTSLWLKGEKIFDNKTTLKRPRPKERFSFQRLHGSYEWQSICLKRTVLSEDILDL
jgi:hypothetical protein